MSVCPRAKSDTTPCVIRHGETARADDGCCVGCGSRSCPSDPPPERVYVVANTTEGYPPRCGGVRCDVPIHWFYGARQITCYSCGAINRLPER